jgi:hypothetical protein
MTADIKRICDRVDVTAPLHWDCTAIIELLLKRFPYVLEISEHASMEWCDRAGGFVPVLGGWFVAITRQTRPGEQYFPNEWEQDCFNLPGDLSSRGFDYGPLAHVLDFVERTKRELAVFGFASVIVFRPGPQWLPRGGRLAAVASHSRGAA